MSHFDAELRPLGPCLWEVPRTGRMNVPVRVYADETLLRLIKEDNALEQAVNVAFLPGIVKCSLAMPDAHWGYGFPIGGVAATDPEAGGVISPGGIGFDINCGVRAFRTDLTAEDVRPRIEGLIAALFHAVPCGVGSEKAIERLGRREEEQAMVRGAAWAVDRGYGLPEDIERTEERGAIEGADPDAVGDEARKRGAPQMGTLGSGNHFLEIDVVDQVYDAAAADAFGLAEGLVVVQIHCGSRGFGHQVCSDYVRVMQRAAERCGYDLPDRQLACAPVDSPEGKRYLSAMAAAANYAWANRQTIMYLAIGAMAHYLGCTRESLGIRLIYDVCHNIAKFEEHDVGGGVRKRVCVHRKGATRAFPAGHPSVPEVYRATGQPVLIPGDMGTCSFVCVGTPRAMEETFGTTCHGAGRQLSRHAAIKKGRGHNIIGELKTRGVTVRAKDRQTLAEEMPDAYKDVEDVVRVMCDTGVLRRVARLRPIGVMKG